MIISVGLGKAVGLTGLFLRKAHKSKFSCKARVFSKFGTYSVIFS
jgi:predicted cation transporter